MGVLAEKRVFGMVWMLIIVTILGHTKNRKDVFTIHPKISLAWFVGLRFMQLRPKALGKIIG